ncbi:dynamin family protein, partial [Paenibacillus graminis]
MGVNVGTGRGEIPNEILKEQPYLGLRMLLEQWGDSAAVQIITDLETKAAAGELTFAFCGHFSAGKSSMINQLCGKPVLPSGPVPTSANIVSIRSGSPRVLVYPRTLETEAKPEPWETTPEQLQNFCRKGGEYSAISVWENVPLLGSHGVLMDTPGVDSTDNGHQAATHSALHLADVVFYVMDYNHVQSENNLAFAKALSEWGKPLYLIINQIDKHREQEITIELYRQQLESAFGHWGIHPAGILFTSLKVQEHPLNQWEHLQSLIDSLLKQREELLQYSLSRSLYHTADAALGAYREEQSEERERLVEEAGAVERDYVEQELQKCAEELVSLDGLGEEARLNLRAGVDALLGNSSLMPAEVREAAGAYAESVSPGFRKGLLFTAAKREKEQQKRLAAWHTLQTREIAAQLEWHLLQLVRQWGEGLGVWDEAAETALKQAFPAVSPAELAAAVKPGTGFSGEALLNFCRTLAAEMKAQFRRAALGVGDELLAKLPPLVDGQ